MAHPVAAPFDAAPAEKAHAIFRQQLAANRKRIPNARWILCVRAIGCIASAGGRH